MGRVLAAVEKASRPGGDVLIANKDRLQRAVQAVLDEAAGKGWEVEFVSVEDGIEVQLFRLHEGGPR